VLVIFEQLDSKLLDLGWRQTTAADSLANSIKYEDVVLFEETPVHVQM